MSKNIAIFVLVILVGLYFFDVIGSEKKEPELINNNIIKLHTYSLYSVDSGLFKINHETGEAFYFSSGVFIPVLSITTEQIQQMQPMTKRDRTNGLLDQYD